jgi:hypothetical protein
MVVGRRRRIQQQRRRRVQRRWRRHRRRRRGRKLVTHAVWLWIPVTIWAAFAQTIRNAVQRGLTAELGTLGATLVRFLYGLPFAALWLGSFFS